jgi:hypothetical protein
MRLLLSVLPFLLACALPVAVLAAEAQQGPNSNAARSDADNKPPLIIHNPDGTLTVQKEPGSAKSEDAEQKGLMIRPQVVVPTVRAPAKDPSNQAH